MGAFLERRRAETASRLSDLRSRLDGADALTRGRACVYLTGSFGRLEASPHSDLDLFIMGRVDGGDRALSRLDEICIKASLIEAVREMGIVDFSGDGEYLVHYTVNDLVGTLGRPEDDANNTFTARLLMLLESRPLLEDETYRDAIRSVIAAYWKDYEHHESEFVPGFLANDILRLWRTFCVNYEARTSKDPLEKKAKRRLKNYKLKHSRLLTCYSALAYLLATFTEGATVSPDDALAMTELSPSQRLEWLARKPAFSSSHAHVDAILSCYERFLAQTDAAEADLVARFLDEETSRRYMRDANELGDLVYRLLQNIGDDNRFRRLLLV